MLLQVVQMTKDVLVIREEYKDLIYKAANQAVADGSPINRPMWWVDPEDSETYTIDSRNLSKYIYIHRRNMRQY